MLDKPQSQVVLLGAGNTNLQVVKWWGMEPPGTATLALVSESYDMPYSGMLPGCIAGRYSRDEVTIDLSRLCAASGVSFIRAFAQRICCENNEIIFRDRPPMRYDILCMNVGSQPCVRLTEGAKEKSLLLKPLFSLMDRVEAVDQLVESSSAAFPLVVIGGGASAFELAMALRTRYAEQSNVCIEILMAGSRPLQSAATSVSRACQRALRERGISMRTGVRVEGADADYLKLDHGEQVPYAACVWATHAEPPDIVAASGFDCNERGFLRVHDTLQYVGNASVFASGDAISMASHPALPKAGVYAVRQGPTLWDNLQARLEGHSLRAYSPQPRTLFLLNSGDGGAIMSYGKLASRGKWAFAWKDYIDRKWVRKFADTYQEAMSASAIGAEEDEMRCGGCGAKLSGEILNRVLHKLDVKPQTDVLVGCVPGDDAAVMRLPSGKVQLQTVDFFKSFVDDPFLLGRIAATNALSDIFAMNGVPSIALALVTIPLAGSAIRESQLFQVLSGALETFHENGVTLAGGHTTESMDFQIGFCITGYADENRLFKKDALKPGDRLIVTKPLGSGAILRAATMGQCEWHAFDSVLHGMRMSNGPAAKIFDEARVRACTDVTGFGLAGHLVEMLDASSVSAKLNPQSIPLYPGFHDLTNGQRAEPVLSTLHEENAKHARRITPESANQLAWLYDPQTSGGLLAGVAQEDVDNVLAGLRDAGYSYAVEIGEVLGSENELRIHI